MTLRRALLREAAQTDLLLILEWIAEQSRDVARAEEFVARLRAKCDEIASLPGALGREREDLGSGLRSVAWRRYLIIFRYADGMMEVVRILHGMRDLPTLLKPNDES